MDRLLSSNQRVECFSLGEGLRVFRIFCQVLPHLAGYVHLLENRKTGLNLLIDTGSGEGTSPDDIHNGLSIVEREFGGPSVRHINRIILTHTHVDHFGGAWDLKNLTGAEIWVHAFESRTVCSYNERASVSNVQFRRYALECGILPDEVDDVLRAFGFLPGRIRPVRVDHVLYGGEEIDGLTFYHLPGHSPGSLAFSMDNAFFIGDTVLSHTLTQIWPESLMPHTGLTHYLESLDRLTEIMLHLTEKTGTTPIIFPGHEDILENLSKRLELVRKSTHRRNQRVLDLLAKSDHPLTVDEIARRMYLTAHASRAFFAICDIGARLEYLQQRGKVTVVNYEELDTMPVPVYRFGAL